MPRWRRAVAALVAGVWWCSPTVVEGQATDLVGLPVTAVRVEQEGKPVDDRLIRGLIEVEIGQPLSMRNVREAIDHLYGLNRFDDIQVSAAPDGAGVSVAFVLVPRHAVQAVEFHGTLGVPESEVRQAVTTRFGALPSAARADDIARELSAWYEQRGFVRAQITPGVRELHNPDRAVLVFNVEAGPRAGIDSVRIDGLEGPDRLGLQSELEIARGRPYDRAAIDRRLERYQNDLRARGYYEARASQDVTFTEDGRANVTLTVVRGPRVSIAFAGDPLPADVREELVPLRREGSVDEDLLEDAERAIEGYLHARGYRDADARHSRELKGDELVITFTVSRGARHLVDGITVRGNSSVSSAELLKLVQAEAGEPFVEDRIARGAEMITELYRTRGFTRAEVEETVAVLPRAPGASAAGERRVTVTLVVNEGPRTVIGAVSVEGSTVLTEGQIRSLMTTAPGGPYSEVAVAQDRDRVQLEYLNRGYESVAVTPHVTMAERDTRADVRLAIVEGQQVIVDHIIIIGNRRTSTETIRRALVLEEGEPLGYAARAESQQRLAALGLFRRFRITDLRHGSEPRRDVLVEVEEAPATTVGYGGGVEGGTRLRTSEQGQAEERFELAPRGFVEIGRRNLFGKNRSVNLFGRIALKRRQGEIAQPVPESEFGFNEYRVLAAYREPRLFNGPVDALVTGTLDQAIRSTFNFRSREVRAEVGTRLAQRYGLAGRYSFEQNELFDEQITEDQRPIIDRLFPEVKLSKFSATVFRDTRNDPLDPDRGTFLSADNDLALRAIGSEVGFVKTYLQAAGFRRLPSARRVVVRLRGIVGLAQGFERAVPEVDLNGVEVVFEELPASERFFAGGDTSVRGFSLDRLGTAETITETGFPKGGNGLVIFNSELLVNLWRALDVVGFMDAGNVFPRVDDMDFTDLRPAAGFGFRYRSPVGPVRIDLGFNLDPRELVPGTLERRAVLHVSLGQTF